MTASFALCSPTAASCFVRSFWQTAGAPQHRAETILPKGVVELIFSFQQAVPVSRSGRQPEQSTPRCFVNGMSNIPVELQAPQQQEFFGVVLHPAAVKTLLHAPCGLFLNALVDLEAVSNEFGNLWHRLAEAGSFENRVLITEDWMAQQARPLPDREIAIGSYLESPPAANSVTNLAAQFCYSPRQLNRKMQDLFGLPTEAVIGYKRYLHALHRVHHSNESLTRIAYDCNYYDQAHFIREFRTYTGCTPGEYRQQKSGLPGHLFQ